MISNYAFTELSAALRAELREDDVARAAFTGVVRGVLVGLTAELTQSKGCIDAAINVPCQLGLIAGPGGAGYGIGVLRA